MIRWPTGPAVIVLAAAAMPRGYTQVLEFLDLHLKGDGTPEPIPRQGR